MRRLARQVRKGAVMNDQSAKASVARAVDGSDIIVVGAGLAGLFTALKLEKIAMFIILLLIVLVRHLTSSRL